MKSSKEITIYDIARELNISPATVSRGLKDHPSISKQTRTKIMEAAEQMGYRFNTFASNLRRQRTNTIGVIVPRLNSSFMSSALAGMEKAINQSGYNLIISQSLETKEKEKTNARTMFDNRVDGLIVSLAADSESADYFQPFIQKSVPLFFFDRVWENMDCPKFVIDNFKAGYDATKHLIVQGCTNIAHIGGDMRRNVYTDRFSGYNKALYDHGLKPAETIVNCDLSIESGSNAAQKLLQQEKLPDGLFVSNDICAVSCMQTLKSAGVKIPEDIAVVGFNNDPISSLIEPQLSTINYPGYEMGETVARNLIGILNNNVGQRYTTVIQSGLIIRASSLKNKEQENHS